MRSGLMILFFFHVLVCAQAQQGDSVLLPMAVVVGIPEENFLKGSVVHALDSSVRKNSISQHLGETLPIEFPIYFRNYGNGMLSSISLRGTSSQHTAVLWNGININSFSLGQADFSNLLTGATNTVKVHAGGGSARFGSGALGGTILLNAADRSPALNVVQEIGSFGRYFTTLQGSVDIGKLYLNSSGYWMQSENDFKVLSTGQRQQHASYLQRGFQQQVRYQWDNAHQLSLNYWYHDADREIQPTVGKAEGSSEYLDEQQDKNHRVAIQYKSASQRGVFSSTVGFVQDVIVFNNDPSTVNRWIAGVNHQFKLPGLINVEVGGQWNHIIAKMHQYDGGGATEDRVDLLASFQKDFGDRLSLSLNIRQPYVSGFNAPFLPYVGAEYILSTTGHHVVTLRANVSRNYRAPTLNDRYWPDAGNKNLLPETSLATEGGVRWQWRKFVFDNTYFFQDVDQWIQWERDTTQKESERFRPENVKRVRINGFETRIRWQKSIGRLVLIPVFSYQFASSVTREDNDVRTIGKQLIYSPKHIIASYLQLRYKTYSAMATVQFNGKRYTEPTNTDDYALDPFTVINFSIGKSWDVSRHQFNLLASVRNLFNQDYRLYAARAVPGRNYSIQLTYQLNHKNDEN
jgi:vitamin B12 transporter